MEPSRIGSQVDHSRNNTTPIMVQPNQSHKGTKARARKVNFNCQNPQSQKAYKLANHTRSFPSDSGLTVLNKEVFEKKEVLAKEEAKRVSGIIRAQQEEIEALQAQVKEANLKFQRLMEPDSALQGFTEVLALSNNLILSLDRFKKNIFELEFASTLTAKCLMDKESDKKFNSSILSIYADAYARFQYEYAGCTKDCVDIIKNIEHLTSKETHAALPELRHSAISEIQKEVLNQIKLNAETFDKTVQDCKQATKKLNKGLDQARQALDFVKAHLDNIKTLEKANRLSLELLELHKRTGLLNQQSAAVDAVKEEKEELEEALAGFDSRYEAKLNDYRDIAPRIEDVKNEMSLLILKGSRPLQPERYEQINSKTDLSQDKIKESNDVFNKIVFDSLALRGKLEDDLLKIAGSLHETKAHLNNIDYQVERAKNPGGWNLFKYYTSSAKRLSPLDKGFTLEKTA